MRRATQAHARLPAGGRARHLGATRHDHRQRPGPEGLHEPARHRGPLLGEGLCCRLVEHVHDERMLAGATLGREDTGDCRVVVGARGEPVDRLGRHRDEAARDDAIDRLRNGR
jgi:hypothetical protein